MQNLRESLRRLTGENERCQADHENIHSGVIALEEMALNTDTDVTEMMTWRDLEGKPLAKDTYSLLMVSDIWTPQFIFSVSIFLFQITIYYVLIARFLFNESDVPANVSHSVKLLQFAALITALMSQDDTVYSIVSLSILFNQAESSDFFGNFMRAREEGLLPNRDRRSTTKMLWISNYLCLVQ